DAMSGPRVAISGFLPSNDGSRVAVVLAPGGSENGVLHVVDVKSGAMLADAADRADFGAVSWSDDDRTVYYLRRQALNPGDPPVAKYLNVRTYGHVVGTPAANDVAVFGAGVDPAVPIPPTTFAVFATSTESPYVAGLLIAGVDRFATVYVAPKSALGEPATIPWRRVIAHDDLVTNAAMHGDTIYALTAKNAPRFRLVSFKVGQTFADAKDVIPAGTRVIDNAATAGDAVYVQSREDGLGRITRVAYDGTRTEIPLPVNGTIAGLATEFDRPGFLLQLESWTESPRWYAYDPASGTLRDTKLDPPSPVDYSGVVADEVRVPARDGVIIPLSVIHRRDMKLDGSNPTMLYAYGSYGISSDPSFSAGRLAFLERGGIIAVAHVRGGGEYGEEWHLAGKDANKINTIGDFIDCAKWMIAQRYTSPAKLGARGGSAGGITMGGAITRDPADLAERTAERSRVRQRDDGTGLQEPVRDERGAPRRARHAVSRGDADDGHQRSARRPVAGREDGRDAPGRERGAAPDPAARRLQRRPRAHRRDEIAGGRPGRRRVLVPALAVRRPRVP